MLMRSRSRHIVRSQHVPCASAFIPYLQTGNGLDAAAFHLHLINAGVGEQHQIFFRLQKGEFGVILIPDEDIVAAFRIFRDKWVFTTKRLIMLNVQGVTGSKRDYHSIPYRSIDQFSVETSGTFDGDCEMKLWVKGMPEPLKKEFKRDVDVKALQRILATYVLG